MLSSSLRSSGVFPRHFYNFVAVFYPKNVFLIECRISRVVGCSVFHPRYLMFRPNSTGWRLWAPNPSFLQTLWNWWVWRPRTIGTHLLQPKIWFFLPHCAHQEFFHDIFTILLQCVAQRMYFWFLLLFIFFSFLVRFAVRLSLGFWGLWSALNFIHAT